ncbi:MAG: CmcJ/NvfI family oxidoreductase [Burkholderiaceae bacterium]
MNSKLHALQADPVAVDVTAAINYMDEAVVPSLYRNGRLFTRRDRDGSDGEFVGMVVDKRRLPVADARALGDSGPGLERSGFAAVADRLRDPDLDFLDHDAVIERYYPACAELVGVATGAARVLAFDHNVRSATGKESGARVAGGQQVQGPARIVHGDYTLTSAPQRLRDLARPPTGNDTLRAIANGKPLLDADLAEDAIMRGRFAIINVWRSIRAEPVARFPMALCDGQSVAPVDLSVFEIHYADRIGENYFARYSAAHRWYYYPHLTRDEALLIKQWDSAGPLARSQGQRADDSDAGAPCSFSFHTAIRHPGTTGDSPDRWSIEVRCAVIY